MDSSMQAKAEKVDVAALADKVAGKAGNDTVAELTRRVDALSDGVAANTSGVAKLTSDGLETQATLRGKADAITVGKLEEAAAKHADTLRQLEVMLSSKAEGSELVRLSGHVEKLEADLALLRD